MSENPSKGSRVTRVGGTKGKIANRVKRGFAQSHRDRCPRLRHPPQSEKAQHRGKPGREIGRRTSPAGNADRSEETTGRKVGNQRGDMGQEKKIN
jgi:hypothetical protein